MLKFITIIALKRISVFFYLRNKLNILNIFLGLLVIINSGLIVFILNYIGSNKPIELKTFFYSFYLGILILIIFSNFFPSFSRQTWLIPKAFPISPIKRILFQYFYDFLSITNLYVVALIIILTFSKYFDGIHFTKSILVLLNSYLIAKLFKLIIAYTLKAALVILTVLLILLNFISIYYINSNIIFVFLLILQPFILIVNAALIIKNEERNFFKYTYKPKLGAISFRLFSLIIFKRKAISQSLFVLFLFKIILITIKAVPFNKTHNILNFDVPTIICLSPVLLFTYVFNNFNGYLSELWYYVNKMSSFKIYVKSYLYILAIPIFVDFLLSLLFALYSNIEIQDFALLYIPQLCLLIPLGIILSIKKPIRIKKTISLDSLKSNTWLLGSVITIIISIVSGLLLNSGQLLLLYYLLLFIIIISIFFSAFKTYKYNFSSIFSKLFSNNK